MPLPSFFRQDKKSKEAAVTEKKEQDNVFASFFTGGSMSFTPSSIGSSNDRFGNGGFDSYSASTTTLGYGSVESSYTDDYRTMTVAENNGGDSKLGTWSSSFCSGGIGSGICSCAPRIAATSTDASSSQLSSVEGTDTIESFDGQTRNVRFSEGTATSSRGYDTASSCSTCQTDVCGSDSFTQRTEETTLMSDLADVRNLYRGLLVSAGAVVVGSACWPKDEEEGSQTTDESTSRVMLVQSGELPVAEEVTATDQSSNHARNREESRSLLEQQQDRERQEEEVNRLLAKYQEIERISSGREVQSSGVDNHDISDDAAAQTRQDFETPTSSVSSKTPPVSTRQVTKKVVLRRRNVVQVVKGRSRYKTIESECQPVPLLTARANRQADGPPPIVRAMVRERNHPLLNSKSKYKPLHVVDIKRNGVGRDESNISRSFSSSKGSSKQTYRKRETASNRSRDTSSSSKNRSIGSMKSRSTGSGKSTWLKYTRPERNKSKSDDSSSKENGSVVRSKYQVLGKLKNALVKSPE